MLSRLALVALLGLAALASSGCEALCNQATKIGVFCPETPENQLNDAPQVYGEIGVSPSSKHPGCKHQVRAGDRISFALRGAVDPDGDPLFYEWDLDGDGEYEAGGETPSRTYAAPGAYVVRVRVTDFAYNLGAPGTVERSLRMLVVDPARNRPPRAALTASAPAVTGSAVVFDAGGTTDPDSNDVDLAYGWSFGDGTFAPAQNSVSAGLGTLTHAYAAPGDYTVRLMVQDCSGGNAEITGQITVRDPAATERAPTARFAVTPAEPFAGQLVTLDGSASADPNGQIASYEWDVDGDGMFERSGALATTRFEGAGAHVVRLRVTDDEGLVNVEAGTVTVRRNLPPSAIFIVLPSSPFVNTDVDLDARTSSDDGDITRYEWDLDGNGSFETDGGDVAILTTRFATAGERFVRLQVTDDLGLTAIVGRTFLVRPESTRAHAAQAAPPVVFTARLQGVPVRAGTVRRRTLVGVVGRGNLRARVLGDSPATRFLRARWHTRVSFTARGASALALARSGRSAVCLRIRLSGRPKRMPSGRLTVLGGRGAGARLHGGATLRFRLERDGSASVLGTLNVRRGTSRPLPRRCRSL